MNGIPADGRGGLDWWCAVADSQSTMPATVRLCTVGDVLVRHASGRPWIVGSQRSRAVRVLDRGAIRVAVLGEALTTDDRLARAVSAEFTSTIERLLRLPGSFYVAMAGPHGTHAAGDVAGFRRLHTARVDGNVLVASRADVLRRLIDAPVSDLWLAGRLASPEPPSVLRDNSGPFTGVTPVPPGHRVEIVADMCRVVRWWQPPEPTQPLSKGGPTLRAALTESVVGRTAERRTSVQLSGGLDSTSLAFLARQSHPLLISTAGRSPANDDLRWARNAAALLPEATHRIVTADEAPLFFADLDQPQPGMDEPAPFAAGGARQRYVARLLADQGVASHLNGQGGDEVLLAPLAYLRQAIRVAPRIGWRHMRGHAALRNLSSWSMAKAVLGRQSFPRWLHQVADTLRVEWSAAMAATGWEAPPLLPPWSTHHAADLLRTGILSAERPVTANDFTIHSALVRIRASAYRAAIYRDAMHIAGVPTAMPFFDRSVVDECLSVRPWERTNPWCPKPLLLAALQDVVPPSALSRRTKAEYNADIHHGWTHNAEQVRGLLEPARLSTYGLIDQPTLRAELARFGPSGLPLAWITELIAIETWLRDLAPPLAPTREAHDVATAQAP
jgi:asparagine synthase (glutamine-hydrolysing)